MAMSENSKKVFTYVKEMNGENITAKDIADALEIPVKSVNGIITSAFQKKDLMARVPAQIEVPTEDGGKKYKDVKFIVLTEKGQNFDPDAIEEASK